MKILSTTPGSPLYNALHRVWHVFLQISWPKFKLTELQNIGPRWVYVPTIHFVSPLFIIEQYSLVFR